MTDINELFSTDPTKHTDADIDAIISHMRENRKQFLSNPGAVKGKKSVTSTKKSSLSDSISLDLKL